MSPPNRETIGCSGRQAKPIAHPPEIIFICFSVLTSSKRNCLSVLTDPLAGFVIQIVTGLAQRLSGF